MADNRSNSPATRVYEIDPVAGTVSIYTGAWVGSGTPGFGTCDLCVAFDKLWAVAADDYTTGQWNLYEFTGTGFTLNSQISQTTNTIDNVGFGSGKPVLWTDNTNLYVVACTARDEVDGANIGSTCYRGVPSGATFTWVQDDGTVAAALQPGVRAAPAAREDLWGVYVDNDTDPLNPAFYLFVAPGTAPGTSYTVYRWEGFGTEMGTGTTTGETGPGASVTTAFTLPEMKYGGAEAISQPEATYGEIEAESQILGAYRLFYRTPGTVANLTGRVYFSLGQGPPDTLAVLVGGGNTFGPITGDSRASLRTVDIDLTLSGITSPPSDSSNWMIKLEP